MTATPNPATPTPAVTPIKFEKPQKILRQTDVQNFKFEYENDEGKTVKMVDVEGILISPNWSPHRFDQKLKKCVAEKPEGSNTITIDEFKMLKIPESVMRDGILFIWVEKELIYEIIKFFEDQKFEYIENLCHVMLDRTQIESTKLMKNTDATSAIHRESYPFLNKSHRTLLMLRRN